MGSRSPNRATHTQTRLTKKISRAERSVESAGRLGHEGDCSMSRAYSSVRAAVHCCRAAQGASETGRQRTATVPRQKVFPVCGTDELCISGIAQAGCRPCGYNRMLYSAIFSSYSSSSLRVFTVGRISMATLLWGMLFVKHIYRALAVGMGAVIVCQASSSAGLMISDKA